MDAYELYNKLGEHSPSNSPLVVVSLDTGQQYELLDTVSEDGQFTLYFGDAPAEPTYPRREVVAKAIAERMNSAEDIWFVVDEPARDRWRADADAVLAALDAHAQREDWEQFVQDARRADSPARYRDCDGDWWEEQRDGTLSCITEGGKPAGPSRRAWAHGYSVVDLDEQFGPLTRIS